MSVGCASCPTSFGGGVCGPVGLGHHRGHCQQGCASCTPPWMPYLGHYKQRFDDCVTRQTALHCAWRDLDQCGYHKSCGCAGDFAAGFERAYIDLAENRAPQPPSVPPSKYWSAYYRSCAGRQHVEDWYAGYQAGLEQGRQGGVSQFNRIDVWSCGSSMNSGGYEDAELAAMEGHPPSSVRPGCPCQSH